MGNVAAGEGEDVFHFSISSKKVVEPFIDLADRESIKVGAPNTVVGRFEADVVAGECLTEEDVSTLPADVASRPDLTNLAVTGVVRLFDSGWKWSARTLVQADWALHAHSFVRPFFVIDPAKVIKLSLLLAKC